MLEKIEKLWPLSKNFIYAPEIGLSLRMHRPDLWRDWGDNKRLQDALLSQAAGLAFLRWFEKEGEARDLLPSFLDAGVRTRIALDWQTENTLPKKSPAVSKKELYFFGRPSGVLPKGKPLLGRGKIDIHDLSSIHSPDYIGGVLRAFEKDDERELDKDTILSRKNILLGLEDLSLALAAVKSKEKLTLLLLDERSKLVEKNRGRAGHLFNTVAWTADRMLREKQRKVAVVNVSQIHPIGLQDIFYSRSDVLSLSIHSPLPSYTGTGGEEDTGLGQGRGFNINIEFEQSLAKHSWQNPLRRFRPEHVFLLADGTLQDPLPDVVSFLLENRAPVTLVSRDKEVIESSFNLIP